jgi:hypothetical protein
MHLLAHVIAALAFRRLWRRRLVDEHAVLIAAIGLTRAEEEAFLSLRRRR